MQSIIHKYSKNPKLEKAIEARKAFEAKRFSNNKGMAVSFINRNTFQALDSQECEAVEGEIFKAP